MKEYIVYLYPHSSFEGNLTSSTLFGALCWGIRLLHNESVLQDILKEFLDKKPVFLISSLFPFTISGKFLYLPKPVYPPLTHEILKSMSETESDNLRKDRKLYHSDKFNLIGLIQKYKEFKKIEWISVSQFESIAQIGIKGEQTLFSEYLKNRLKNFPWKKDLGVQKNSLDRLTYSTEGAGNTFYNQEKFFRKNEIGLYFLLKTDKMDLLEPVLKFLEDSGLGTNKYTGKNHFNAEIKEKEITLNTKGNSFVTLSKYVEKNKDNVDFSKSYYETDFMRFKIESREEFSGENIWKDIIPYIREGSVITLKQESEYPGEIFPIKQIHEKTIYQYGFAYPYRGDFGKEIEK